MRNPTTFTAFTKAQQNDLKTSLELVEKALQAQHIEVSLEYNLVQALRALKNLTARSPLE